MMDTAPSLLWTAMPMELVVDGLNPEAQACAEVMMGGRLLLVRPGTNGMGIVERLVSGNPQDYLDPRWQPGAEVSLTQQA